MKLVRYMEIDKGDEIPRGYGFSYYDPLHYIRVLYPWPLNHLVAWTRNLWLTIRHVASDNAYQAYKQGFTEGYRQGSVHTEDWRQVFESIIRKIDNASEKR